MIKLCLLIISMIIGAFNYCGENIAEALEERDWRQTAAYSGLLALLVAACVAGILGLLYLAYLFWWVILAVYLAGAGLYALLHRDREEQDETDEFDHMMAEERAREDHSSLSPLIFQAILSASENTSIVRPRDQLSIESSRDKSYYFEGNMAVHQFEIDFSGQLEANQAEIILEEIRRQVVKYAQRYPLTIREGRLPVMYDIKNAGSFLILEVVLYSSENEDKILARRRARFEHKRRMGEVYDRDF